MKIQISDRAAKQLKKISRTHQSRIINAIESLADSSGTGKKLMGKLSRYRSLRVGDYRIIYESEPETIRIAAIGHRKHVYDLIRRILNFLFGL